MDDEFFERDAYNVQEMCEAIGMPREYDPDGLFVCHGERESPPPPLYVGDGRKNAKLRLVSGVANGIDFEIKKEDGSWEQISWLNGTIGVKLLIAWLGLKLHKDRYDHIPYDIVKKMANPKQRSNICSDELLTHPSETVRALGKILQELMSE